MMDGLADLVYQFGMADLNQAKHIEAQTTLVVNFIKNKEFYEAFKVKCI